MGHLAQIEALERAHSLPLGGAPVRTLGKKGRMTCQVSHKYFQLQIHHHVMSVAAKATGAAVPGPDTSVQSDAVGQSQLGPVEGIPELGGDPVQPGEYNVTPQ